MFLPELVARVEVDRRGPACGGGLGGRVEREVDFGVLCAIIRFSWLVKGEEGVGGVREKKIWKGCRCAPVRVVGFHHELRLIPSYALEVRCDFDDTVCDLEEDFGRDESAFDAARWVRS